MVLNLGSEPQPTAGTVWILNCCMAMSSMWNLSSPVDLFCVSKVGRGREGGQVGGVTN